MCLVCTKFKLCSPSQARNLTAQGCEQLQPAKFKKQLLESAEASEQEDQTRKDSPKVSQQSVVAAQTYQSTQTIQNPYYEPSPTGPRYYQGSFNRQCSNKCGFHQFKCALNLSRCSGSIVLEEVLSLQHWQICLTL